MVMIRQVMNLKKKKICPWLSSTFFDNFNGVALIEAEFIRILSIVSIQTPTLGQAWLGFLGWRFGPPCPRGWGFPTWLPSLDSVKKFNMILIFSYNDHCPLYTLLFSELLPIYGCWYGKKTIQSTMNCWISAVNWLLWSHLFVSSKSSSVIKTV